MELFKNIPDNKDSLTKQQKLEEKMETKRTKEDAQRELFEKFGNEENAMRKTSDFQSALQQGKIELAEEWLSYIVENKESFPQYKATWDSWLSDREHEIELYKQLKDEGNLDKVSSRSKEDAQRELFEKFGGEENAMRKTSDFQMALKRGEVKKAELWLSYVRENKFSFPQYLATWDSWLSDRERELADARAQS